MGVMVGLAFAAAASCALSGTADPVAFNPAKNDPSSCVVAVFPGAPPFAVEDLGPIQASCPNSVRQWSSCGIDQPNLLDIACASGADTVFGLYELVTPKPGMALNGARVMHARLGRRREEVGRAEGSELAE